MPLTLPTVVVDIGVIRVVLDSLLERLERFLRVALFHVHTRDLDPRLGKRGDEHNGREEILFCTLHVIDQKPEGSLGYYQ